MGLSTVTRLPPIVAPDRTVTEPLNTTTSPSTVPVITVCPLKTTRDSVTRPSIVAGPLKITALSTVSPSATTRRPLNTICSVGVLVGSLCAPAGPANVSTAARATPSINADRTRGARVWSDRRQRASTGSSCIGSGNGQA